MRNHSLRDKQPPTARALQQLDSFSWKLQATQRRRRSTGLHSDISSQAVPSSGDCSRSEQCSKDWQHSEGSEYAQELVAACSSASPPVMYSYALDFACPILTVKLRAATGLDAPRTLSRRPESNLKRHHTQQLPAFVLDLRNTHVHASDRVDDGAHKKDWTLYLASASCSVTDETPVGRAPTRTKDAVAARSVLRTLTSYISRNVLASRDASKPRHHVALKAWIWAHRVRTAVVATP